MTITLASMCVQLKLFQSSSVSRVFQHFAIGLTDHVWSYREYIWLPVHPDPDLRQQMQERIAHLLTPALQEPARVISPTRLRCSCHALFSPHSSQAIAAVQSRQRNPPDKLAG